MNAMIHGSAQPQFGQRACWGATFGDHPYVVHFPPVDVSFKFFDSNFDDSGHGTHCA